MEGLSWWQRYVWAGRAVQTRQQQLTLDQLLAEEGRPTAAGEAVTADPALRHSTVWACVRLLADSVSTLPLAVFRGDDRDPLPTPALLRRPSADFDEFADWCWGVMASLLLRGNAWGVITARAGAGMLPAQVDLVHPDRVAVTLEEGRWVYRVGGQRMERADLWHVKAYPFPGSPLGLSPIAYAREAIGLGLGAERYGAKFFGDSGVPSGYLYSDQRLDKPRLDQLKAEWEKAHKGKRGTAVLSQVKYQNLSIAPEEAQFLGTVKANAAAICRFFGIPAAMLAGVELAGHEDYSSPEMRGQDFLTFTLRPWLLRIERAVSKLLPSTQAAKFNAGGFLRATLREQYEALNIGVAGGFVTVNEAREKLDLPPLAQPARPLGAVA
jgi:HK97 family phage portal protein